MSRIFKKLKKEKPREGQWIMLKSKHVIGHCIYRTSPDGYPILKDGNLTLLKCTIDHFQSNLYEWVGLDVEDEDDEKEEEEEEDFLGGIKVRHPWEDFLSKKYESAFSLFTDEFKEECEKEKKAEKLKPSIYYLLDEAISSLDNIREYVTKRLGL